MSHSIKYWTCQILGWLTFAVLSIILSSNNSPNLAYADIAFSIFGLTVSHLSRVYIYAKWWNKYNMEQILYRLLGLVPAVALLLGGFYLLLIYFTQVGSTKITLKIASNIFFSSLIIYACWNLLYFIFKFIARNRKLFIERLQMENSVKSLEIKTIKNNLQPHFIFNALNSIRALVDEDPTRARESITQLSNILRNSIQTNKVETVFLHQELEIVKDYLCLESIRYEERLSVVYEIEDNTLQLPVPPMMLQTLVENAIKHGIAATVNGGKIIIKSFIKSNMHYITIGNTGQYVPGGSKAATSDGFGLESTIDRLKFLFGEAATLAIKNINHENVLLTIQIPINK